MYADNVRTIHSIVLPLCLCGFPIMVSSCLCNMAITKLNLAGSLILDGIVQSDKVAMSNPFVASRIGRPVTFSNNSKNEEIVSGVGPFDIRSLTMELFFSAAGVVCTTCEIVAIKLPSFGSDRALCADFLAGDLERDL